jgi:hypothetical protein
MRNSVAGRKGGRTVLLKHGRAHYRRMSALSHTGPRQPPVVHYPVKLTIRLTTEQAEQLAALARKSKRTRGQLLRLAWDRWYVTEGPGSLKKG